MKEKTPKGKVKARQSRQANSKGLRNKKPFPVVAIGASAGGVEASCALLREIDDNLGMVYVFIHHLSATHESHLSEILQRETNMPVHEVTSRTKIERDNVYVISSKTFMSIEEGELITHKRKKKDTHAIDYFMESLAAAYHNRAIGVVLSGTAFDGTKGLKAIKVEGGLTFAQDASATHQEMSSNAQEAGHVDYVLPPHRIAEELRELIRHPYVITSSIEEVADHENEIKEILSIILEKYGVDFFSHYKRNTVNRRIVRRMALSHIESFSGYVKKLHLDPNEVSALYNDFLINVTCFFREADFFTSLKKIVFPALVEGRKKTDPIRIWIPGCSTGEESYSTAIVITEFLEDNRLSIPVQIFSTDLDEKAINKGRSGIYGKESVSTVSPQRISRFFTRIDGHYQIAKRIRDMCTFSPHNVMKDPPFSRIDLVSCQNVLIYIEAAPQRKILQTFHYALKPTGFLLLGKSESIGNASEIFEPLDKHSRFYKKKPLSTLPSLEFAMRPTAPLTPENSKDHRTESDLEREFDKLLLAKYVPASVLVNKDLEILRFRGNTAPYLQPASGKASLSLLKMLKEELVLDIRGLLQKVRKSGEAAVKEDILLDSDSNTVTIEIVPIKSQKEIYYLIVFQSEFAALITPDQKRTSAKNSKVIKLEQSLKEAREQIRNITDDFDVSREQLQSANEEIMSSNEELQSINEELETSKEELQSANEELTTINEELQNRIEELKHSRDYAHAIIETMHGPLVVVNGQLRIRTANNAFYKFFKLSKEETDGKYINEVSNGRWDIPALTSHLRQMFPKKIFFKDLEINHHFPFIGHRTMIVNAHRLVYGPKQKHTEILIAFQDVTAFRQAEHDLLEAQEQLRLALEGGSVGTWFWNLTSNEPKGSKGREQAFLFGLDKTDSFESYTEWLKAVHPDDREQIRELTEKAITNKVPLDIEFRIIRPSDRDVRWILSKANIYLDKSGLPGRLMGINIDITERKQAAEAIAESEKRFHTLSDNAPVMIWMTDAEQNCVFLNKTWLSFTGKTIEEEAGKGWYKGIHPEDLEGFFDVYDQAYRDHEPFKSDYRLKRQDGEYRWIMAHGVPRFTTDQSFSGFIGTCMDITDRIILEKQKDNFMSIASHELKTPVTSIKAYTQILHERFKKMKDESTAMMLSRLDSQVDKLD